MIDVRDSWTFGKLMRFLGMYLEGNLIIKKLNSCSMAKTN